LSSAVVLARAGATEWISLKTFLMLLSRITELYQCLSKLWREISVLLFWGLV